MGTKLASIYNWARNDYIEHPLRFCVEVFAWILSVSCSLIMAATVPHPPLMLLYPMWVTGCVLYAWAAWSRGSVGMLLNYVLLSTIDSIGLVRMLLT